MRDGLLGQYPSVSVQVRSEKWWLDRFLSDVSARFGGGGRPGSTSEPPASPAGVGLSRSGFVHLVQDTGLVCVFHFFERGSWLDVDSVGLDVDGGPSGARDRHPKGVA